MGVSNVFYIFTLITDGYVDIVQFGYTVIKTHSNAGSKSGPGISGLLLGIVTIYVLYGVLCATHVSRHMCRIGNYII